MRLNAHGARELALNVLRTTVARALSQPLVAPRAVDDYLALLGPMWSLDEVRGRITDIVHESADVTSLWLEPNANWRPHLAGQHVLLTADIDGTRRTRSFSLSCAPGRDRLLRITIKAHPGGCVSVWARDRARPGDVVRLSQAQGDFVLPTPAPKKLLFVSGGSGITPLVAMGQQLASDGYGGDLCWVHCERRDVPLQADLEATMGTLERATLHVHRDAKQFLDRAQLQAWVPDWLEREAFVCGPRGLMDLVETSYRDAGRGDRVHHEDYQPRFAVRPLTASSARAGLVTFLTSRQQTKAEPGVPLLAQAERAGLHPAYGCRRGICHTCKCIKRAGTVRNELTGAIHSEPDQEIQLCTHSPVGNVSLEL